MSEHYIKVNDVETVESSNSTALIVLVLTILAVVVIAMVMWQPWASTPQTNSTTIIRETKFKQVAAPGDSRPIIVNPPASAPAATPNANITIHNDPPKTDANNDSGDSNSASGSTGN